MKTVGSSEARNRFSALLDEIERGGEITITKRGRPVARLVPISGQPRMSPAKAIDGLGALRKRLVLKDSWKALRDADRR
jgi:prevent-host-death family protein